MNVNDFRESEGWNGGIVQAVSYTYPLSTTQVARRALAFEASEALIGRPMSIDGRVLPNMIFAGRQIVVSHLFKICLPTSHGHRGYVPDERKIV